MEKESTCKSYKAAKKLDNQIIYLNNFKRVQFNDMDEKIAKEKLLRYNYINVITPFKHYFAKLDKHKEVIKKDNRHIYERDIEFKEYYNYFIKEREQYPVITKNILDFDIQFKSILAYWILTTYELNNSDALSFFLNGLKLKTLKLDGSYKNRIEHMLNHLEGLKKDVTKYADIYCFFDRMSLGNALTIFVCLEKELQEAIFKGIKEFKMNFNTDKVPDFIGKIFCLVSIRNTVMHGNSLEILVRFYNPKTHSLRKSSDKKKFINMIKCLNIEKPRE